MSIDECVKKVELRKGKRMWITNTNNDYKVCSSCPFVGEVRILYCRSAKVYDKVISEQLELPYKK